MEVVIIIILLGIWGSAFSIILDTMNSKEKKTEAQRQDEIGTRFDLFLYHGHGR